MDSRATLMTERVGSGLVRALYATYVSYLPVEHSPTRCRSMATRVACL